MSIYVFGDIQGCYQEMRALLKMVAYKSGEDELWFTGDLINRGPENLKTMQYIMKQQRKGKVQCVLGNHDLHFLAVALGRKRKHRSDTFEDILDSRYLQEIIDWFRRQPLVYYRSPHVLVHAGLAPHWSIETALKKAAEVQARLQSAHYSDFLEQMYGNQPDSWQPGLKGFDRLRVITNYFTRMRYATADGRLELTHKENKRPDGFAPWFELPREKHEDLCILFGHWASIGGITGHKQALALDTGCVWGRSLTLLRLEDGERFSVEAALS